MRPALKVTDTDCAILWPGASVNRPRLIVFRLRASSGRASLHALSLRELGFDLCKKPLIEAHEYRALQLAASSSLTVGPAQSC